MPKPIRKNQPVGPMRTFGGGIPTLQPMRTVPSVIDVRPAPLVRDVPVQSRYVDPGVRRQTQDQAFQTLMHNKNVQWSDPNQRAAMTSGRAESVSPALELTAAGDLQSLIESGADVLRGDYLGGGLGLAVTAASVFVPGTIKIPDWVSDPNVVGLTEELLDGKLNVDDTLAEIQNMTSDPQDAFDVASEMVDAIIESSMDENLSIAQMAHLQRAADEIAEKAGIDRTMIMSNLAQQGVDFVNKWVNHPDFADRVAEGMRASGYDDLAIDRQLREIKDAASMGVDLVNAKPIGGEMGRYEPNYDKGFEDPIMGTVVVTENANLAETGRTAAHELGHRAFNAYSEVIISNQEVADYVMDVQQSVDAMANKSNLASELRKQGLSDQEVDMALIDRAVYLRTPEEIVPRIVEYRYLMDKLIPNFGPKTPIDTQMVEDVANFLSSQDPSFDVMFWAKGSNRAEQIQSVKRLLEVMKVMMPPAVFTAAMYPILDAPESQQQ